MDALYWPFLTEADFFFCQVKFSTYSFTEWGYLAGTDEQRASDVMSMFLDPSVSAIVANRGGFGCGRMIDLLNYTAIAQHPKPIVGYSDLTALLTAIHVKTGLVTFHGPMGIDEWNNSNGDYFRQVIMQAALPIFTNQVRSCVAVCVCVCVCVAFACSCSSYRSYL